MHFSLALLLPLTAVIVLSDLFHPPPHSHPHPATHPPADPPTLPPICCRKVVLGIPLNCVHGNILFLVLYQLAIAIAVLTVGFADSFQVVSATASGAGGGVFFVVGVYLANLLLDFFGSTHGLLAKEARLLLLGLVCAGEAVVRSLAPSAEDSGALYFGGAIVGFLSSVVVIRNLRMTHFERTYVIPAAAFALSAYCIFSVGWYAGMRPPKSIFPTTASAPCCWKMHECKLQLENTDLFRCAQGTNLVARPGATSEVKAQTCSAFMQYAGLQLSANITAITKKSRHGK